MSSLSTKKLDSLAGQTIQLSELNANQEIVGHPLFLALKTSYEPCHANIIKPTFSGMGAEVAKADLKRDSDHGGLHRLIRGFAAFGDTEKGLAAKQLLACFRETGYISRPGYAEENVVLEKLIEKLSTPKALASIALLGIGAEVEQLKQAQAHFSELCLEQADANSELRRQPSASSLRCDPGNALRNYYGYISSMSGVEPWKDICADLKGLIRRDKWKEQGGIPNCRFFLCSTRKASRRKYVTDHALQGIFVDEQANMIYAMDVNSDEPVIRFTHPTFQ